MPQFQSNGLNFNAIFDQYDKGRKQAQERTQLQALAEAGQTLQQGGDLRTAAQGLLTSGNVGGFSQLQQLANQNRGHNLAEQKFEFQKAAGQKPTTAIQNFKFGQQNPNFIDYQQNLKKSGATTVNVAGTKGETAFQKTLGKRSADMFGKFADDAVAAQDNGILLDQLGKVLPQEGGVTAGIKGFAASYGVNVGAETTNLQVFQSLVDRLTPQQRQGLPGSASDRDMKTFRGALPKLVNTPGGNKIILATMTALNAVKLERGRIANLVMTGRLNRKQAIQALRTIRDPLADFKQFRKTNGAQARARQQPQQPQVTHGQTAVNPQTGQRVQFNGQSWEPVQ